MRYKYLGFCKLFEATTLLSLPLTLRELLRWPCQTLSGCMQHLLIEVHDVKTAWLSAFL